VAPFRGADVSLVPLVYIGRPPYWGIQVACKPGDGTGSENEPDGGSAAYSVQIDLAGVTGTHGVEVIGATRTAQLVVMSRKNLLRKVRDRCRIQASQRYRWATPASR
jgi:hypothetical protein